MSIQSDRVEWHKLGRDKDLSFIKTETVLGRENNLFVYFFSGVNSVDFMQSVSDQTKVIQQGLKTLRGEVDNPLRVLDIGQEAIVLSGLNKSAGESLKNIKNLYDETKYLKSYLEKVNFSENIRK